MKEIIYQMTKWKLTLSVLGVFLCFVISTVVAQNLAELLIPNEKKVLQVLITEIVKIFLTVSSLIFFTKYIIKFPILNKKLLSVKNLKPTKWILFGIFFSITSLLTLLLLSHIEVVEINWDLETSIIVGGLTISFFHSIASGFLEELIFRGYMLELLKTRYSFWIAGLSLAVSFSLLHIEDIANVGNNLQILIGGTLFSILLLSIYKTSKNVWNAGIVHAIWNFSIGNDLVKIGNDVGSSSGKVITFSQEGNSFINGGEFGVDLSLVVLLLYAICSIIILKRGVKKHTNQKPLNI